MRTTKCDKRIVICDVKTTKYRDEPIKCEKKIKKPPNVTKVQSLVMLVVYNVRMKPSNVRKKIKEPPNVTKIQSHVMLVLHNVRMVPSNVRKNKWTIECDKSTVISDVGTAQYEDGTIKCEKEKKKKKKGTTECDKSTVTCDVGTAQCEDGTIKCEKKIRK